MSMDTESHLFTSHYSIFSHSSCIIFLAHDTITSLHSSSSFTQSNTVELCTQIITILKKYDAEVLPMFIFVCTLHYK